MPLYYPNCVVCGQPFKASRSDALTCGDNCRQRLQTDRKRLKRCTQDALALISELTTLSDSPVHGQDASLYLNQIFTRAANSMKKSTARHINGDWWLSWNDDGQLTLCEIQDDQD
jgi:predicted nucleic acid-binding Zn ribbon protein